jgi:hypothetical protein
MRRRPITNEQRFVRQQWSFSPDTSTLKRGEFVVNLPEVVILELQIHPGRHDNTAAASLDIPWTLLKQLHSGNGIARNSRWVHYASWPGSDRWYTMSSAT